LYPVSHVHPLDEFLLRHFDEELGFGPPSAEEYSIRNSLVVASNHRLEGFLGSLRGSQGVRIVDELLVVGLTGSLGAW